MDTRGQKPEALLRASRPKTLLVHPFNENEKTNKYLLETPKDIKRKTPLLELPKPSKKPKLFSENNSTNVKVSATTVKVSATTVKASTTTVKASTTTVKESEKYINASAPTVKASETITKISETSVKVNETTNKVTPVSVADDMNKQSDCKACKPVQVCHHCCCKCKDNKVSEDVSICSCQSQPVKVIFAPTMMPSLFGAMPSMQYVIKQPVKVNDKVSDDDRYLRQII